MPKREDETYLNINPPTYKRRYPLATIDCPACGQYSLHFDDRVNKYLCTNRSCCVEGNTLKEITDNKAALSFKVQKILEQI